MGLFRKRLPADRRPALDRDERVLAWSPVDPAGTLVVTNRGLHLPGRADRLAWDAILRATWDEAVLTVVPAEPVAEREGYTVVADGAPLAYRLGAPGEVPHRVRTRVTGSVGYTTHEALTVGGGVRVAGRRRSGADGLTWTVRYDPGTAGDAPEVVEATDVLVAAARAATAPPD
ncbi:hypothetical protein GCM10010123_02430 [Pilimelia anulata]|uniref:Uncharacterized protein n=1 Tax=Pilimelia anulata TaxID=53371 RepID=A0A8J3B6U5_9ACTN|nr:hypothetical protein [Pilimelia anulata]GGJ75977.1 hypothetical protein GCM10010123_02430 [Pilimelia anulata]